MIFCVKKDNEKTFVFRFKTINRKIIVFLHFALQTNHTKKIGFRFKNNVFHCVVNLKRIERVKNERGRDRALLNTNPTK